MENLKSQVKFMNEIEAKEIVEEASEQSQKIIKDAEGEAAKIAKRKMKETEETFQERETSELESAKLEQKRKISNLKTELLTQAIDEATTILKKMSEDQTSQYKESLNKLIVEAVTAIQVSDIEILSNHRDQEVIKQELQELKKKLQKRKGKQLKVIASEETLDCLGGIIVRDKGKKRIFNNTFEARLAKARQELGNKMFIDLFEGKED